MPRRYQHIQELLPEIKEMLAHCNAAILLNSGFDLKVVSEHLGHCDISVTADIYAKVLRNMKIKTAEQVELRLK